MPDPHYLVALGAVILTAASQVLLKHGARQAHGRHALRLWANPFTASAYTIMAAVTLMNLYAFKVVPLRANVVLSPLALFIVIGLSVRLFGERLTRTQLAGLALIALGIAVYNL